LSPALTCAPFKYFSATAASKRPRFTCMCHSSISTRPPVRAGCACHIPQPQSTLRSHVNATAARGGG
jgi:hypothetical protein